MLFMTIESSFIPFPSEAVVPPAAWKAAVSGDMNVVLVVVFATLGALMGALINYYIALWFGRPIVYGFAGSRVGHMCLIDEAKVQKAEKLGVNILSESDFIALIGGTSQNNGPAKNVIEDKKEVKSEDFVQGSLF